MNTKIDLITSNDSINLITKNLGILPNNTLIYAIGNQVGAGQEILELKLQEAGKNGNFNSITGLWPRSGEKVAFDGRVKCWHVGMSEQTEHVLHLVTIPLV